ncbi:hypothetical protein ZOSMA_122G00510 [Zostera marina]|uniref:Alkane hydroxylase MAH1-like n=1 Tax=Zostera marina TaxID=29655 RepID=A0A0K9Q0F2_ZOSMR|nr:hypothetical protein ZOSMA_122G00510 [Zostera marina]
MAAALPTNIFSGILGYPEILPSILCFVFLLHIARRRGPIPTNWPVFGMLPALISNVGRLNHFVTEILENTGCTFLIKGPWFASANMDLLFTCDPANINHIFNTNFANYPKGDKFLEIFDILGNGIFNADNDSWKEQRKSTHGLMAETKFRNYVITTSYDKVRRGIVPLLDQTAEAADGYGRGVVVDLQDLFLRFTFDVTCILVMGVDPACLSPGLPVMPFAKAMDDAEEVLLYRHVVPSVWWKFMRKLRVGEERKFARAWVTIDRFIDKHVQMKKDVMTKNLNTREEFVERNPDLLTSFINGKTYSDKFLRDTAVNLMLAGRDTTAAGLSWFFFLLSKNPEVESKILEELKFNHEGKKFNDQLDAKDMSSLVYLHAALCESLRLYPPVPFEHKAGVQSEMLPSGHNVEPEMKVLVSLYAMARMKGVWGEDCLEYKPERWISNRGRIRYEPSYKFMSFNSGPRSCLGKDIAMTQMKIMAVTLLQNYKIEAVDSDLVVPKTSIILHMKNGLKVRVKKRVEH